MFSALQFLALQILLKLLYHIFLPIQLSHLLQAFQSFWWKFRTKVSCCPPHTLLRNIYNVAKRTLEPWLRYNVDWVLWVVKSYCKVREMLRRTVHSVCFECMTQRRDLVRRSWEKSVHTSRG
jgi:hypothetical protein